MDMETVGLIACGVALVVMFVIPIVYEARKTPEQKAADQERLAKRREELTRGNQIVEVKMLPGGSTVFRMGIVAQQLQKFAIKYADGRIVIKEVHPDTLEYKKLMKYISWDEIR